MELKEWKEYSQEEKERILRHWYYYGKMLITDGERNQFTYLIQMDADLMFNAALLFFTQGFSSQPLVTSMRRGDLVILLNKVLMLINSEGYRYFYDRLSPEFLKTLVKTLNNPEPPVPMSKEEIDRQIDEINGKDTGFGM